MVSNNALPPISFSIFRELTTCIAILIAFTSTLLLDHIPASFAGALAKLPIWLESKLNIRACILYCLSVLWPIYTLLPPPPGLNGLLLCLILHMRTVGSASYDMNFDQWDKGEEREQGPLISLYLSLLWTALIYVFSLQMFQRSPTNRGKTPAEWPTLSLYKVHFLALFLITLFAFFLASSLLNFFIFTVRLLSTNKI